MEVTHDDSSQWEQSKENIQPLKQGRKATVLSVVLDDNATQKLNLMRHEFEEELRTYSGNDPLDVWYRYVLWVEQNYPKGGKEGKLPKLIEKCLMAVYSNSDVREKYVNDQRFLDIWIKYANLIHNPLEIYQTMEAKGLCLSFADLYINWAWEMEKAGNYKRADAIYEKGLQQGAQPLCNLQESHKKFQIRVTRGTIEGRIGDQEVSNLEQDRVALGSLKSQGHRIAVNRSGSALSGPAGRCPQDVTSKTEAGLAFSIFKDTSAKGVYMSTPAGEKDTLGLGASTNQENIKKTSQWTKAKVNRKTIDVEDVDKYHKPKFSVHEDENIAEQRASQRSFSTASHVLSQHKEEYDSWHVQLFIAEPFDPLVQPQYCKHKVYCGTEEFSFEELRGAQYTKAERQKKEKESELHQMRDRLKKQEELIQKLLKDRTDESDQPSSSKVVAPPKESVATQSRVPHQSSRKESKSSHIIYQDSWLSINKSVNASVNASHLHNESRNALLFQSEPPVTLGIGKESAVSMNSVPAVTVNPCHPEQGRLSTSGNSRGLSSTDPTGDAANIIADMWSASLSQSVSHHSGDRGSGVLEAASGDDLAPPIYEDECCSKSQELLGRKSAAAFPIFSDPISQNQQTFPIFSDPVSQNQKTEPAGMPPSTRVLQEKSAAAEASTESKTVVVAEARETIEPPSNDAEDYPETQDENCPPPGMVQPPCEARHISGILQPAKDIPVLQDEESEKEKIRSVNIEERNFEYKQANDIDSLYVSTMKNEDLDDIVPLYGRQLEDFTIKLPNNESVFSHMANIASTPVAWSVGNKQHVPSMKYDFTLATDAENQFPQIQEEENYQSLQNYNKVDMMPPLVTTKALAQTSVITTSATTLPYAETEACLSPIMEASREYRSSSSSSGHTTSNTLQGHSVHGLSHPGMFSLSNVHGPRIRHHSYADNELASESAPMVHAGDFTKSGYLADKSRGESLAESLPHTARAPQQPKSGVSSVPFSSAAAEMMMDFNDMMLSCGETNEEQHPLPVIQVLPPSPGKKCDGSGNIDPFDDKIINQILSDLEIPLHKRGGYVTLEGKMPCLKASMEVTLGKEIFYVCKICGEGAYAKAYRAMTMDPLNVTLLPCDSEEDNEQQVILKVQKPACPWEFYICHELRQRLKNSGYPESVLDSVMKVDRGYFFSNGSVLANQYHKFGTLLDVVNWYRGSCLTMPEEIAMFFMVEIFTILEAVHSCHIIHADIKPDNFLIQGIPVCDTTTNIFEEDYMCLKLIDFGRSIDMKAFPEGTTFTEVVTTDKFTCCEMREKRPWTYQTDYFGAAAIAHLFLFGTYMDVKKTSAGKWDTTVTIKRYWKKDLWKKIFSTLLNVPSCSALPSLSDIKQEIITTFYQAGMHKEIKAKFNALQKMNPGPK